MNLLVGVILIAIATFIVSYFQSMMKEADEKWAEWVFVLINFILVMFSVKSFMQLLYLCYNPR